MLEVADTGVGIPADALPHLFEPGFTSKVEEGRVRGLGLGRFVARHIVEAHQGAIEITSRVGAGATVQMRLPQAPVGMLRGAGRPGQVV